MIRRLLKYDFKEMMRIWWIGAVITLILSFVGSYCAPIFNDMKKYREEVYEMALIFLIVIGLALLVFFITSMIIVFARFYRNFFSDEGYLTFTLPVKKSSLLNSKIISGTILTVVTSLLIAVETYIIFKDMLVIRAVAVEWSLAVLVKELFYLMFDICEGREIYAIIYFIEILIIALASTVFSLLLLYCCITLGSTVVKKAKVVVSVAIYWGVTSLLSTVNMVFMLMVLPTIAEAFFELKLETQYPVAALAFLMAFVFITIGATILYIIQYKMIDRKLNLS